MALLPEVVLENSPEPVRNRVMIRSAAMSKRRLSWAFAHKKRLHEPLIDAGKFFPTTNPRGKAECRVMRFVVALIAQLIETSFKVRLVLAQLEGRQYPTIVSAVAAVVEQ